MSGGTQAFPADNVKLHPGTTADNLTGTMTVTMLRSKYYTNGALFQKGTTQTVTQDWGRAALEQNWATDASPVVLPVGATPAGLSAGEVRTTRTLVSGASISWASRLDPAVAGAGATMITNDVGSVNGVAPFLRWRVSAGLLWRLDGAQDVYVNLIQADGAATAAEQALMQWTGIQTGVLQALRYFWIRGQGSRNNTTDTVTARFRLGTAGTSADAIIHASTNTGLTGTQRSLALEYVAAAVAATTIRTISTANGPTGAAFPGTANGSPAPQQFTVNDMGATTSILSASLQPAATATIPTFNHLIISGY